MSTTDAAVAFLDVSRFTTLTDVCGDAAALAVVDTLTGSVEEALQGQARLVKTLGDGVLLCSRTPVDALEVSIRIIAAFHDHDGLPEIAGGIAQGPVIDRDGDVLGRFVNLSARLSDAAPPGALWVTHEIASVATDMGHQVVPLGSVDLTGFVDPVDAWAVTPCDHVRHATHADPVCGMNITPGPATPRVDLDGETVWFCAEHCRARFEDQIHRLGRNDATNSGR